MESAFNCLWACSRPMGQYRGIYPGRFIERLNAIIPLEGKLILHQFGGTTKQDECNHTVDINPETKPTYLSDARNLKEVPSNAYDIVLADPPYDSQNVNYSEQLYGCEPVKPYSFVKEGVRVLKPGGYYCILHQLVYKCPDGVERVGVIAITTGPNMRIRVLNIFKKQALADSTIPTNPPTAFNKRTTSDSAESPKSSLDDFGCPQSVIHKGISRGE